MSLSLAENVIVAGADNLPSMLDKTMYSSWASRMILYIKGLPQDIYNLMNHREEAKDIWDRVKLLIKGSEISVQEKESKLYDEFDTFTSVPGETIHSYYMRFAQLINDMHIIGMTMKPIQINTKFINHLQPEWSEFVTYVNLAKDLHSTNFDHLYAHLRKHESHANEVRQMKERFPNPFALVANTYNPSPSYTNQAHLNKAVQGRQSQGYPWNGGRSNATTIGVNRYGGTNTASQAKVIKCYNCQEEGHMARQCTKPKRPRNLAWFKEKAMLAEALESGMVLDEEQMAFLADNEESVIPPQASQEIPTLAAFQTDDIDAFNSDCDKAPSESVVLMAKLSTYINSAASENINISNDSNMISYDQYRKEIETLVIQESSSSTQQDTLIMSVIEEMTNQEAKCNKDSIVKGYVRLNNQSIERDRLIEIGFVKFISCTFGDKEMISVIEAVSR
ncbi:retrovirus-related pol polyprotein from transposon TNT 1-94 [Tanacetum coccineum]|uniref:Retrovirus-related pol polyprotein from transposon TNT 1-94 n=1 Tax=Tanacetum coccineum TaxID=301880 RepID=A0ABQ4Z2B2_9ASTR